MNRLTLFVFSAFVFLLTFGLLTQPLFAEDPFRFVCKGQASNSSTCEDRTTSNENPLLGEGGIITRAIEILTTVIGAVSVIVIIIGGFRYIVSSGDANAAKAARDTVLYAVIGLAVAVIARTAVVFVLKKL